jgi:serine/threonine protein kinase
MKDTLPARVRFGAFELDLKSGELCEGDRRTLLQVQPFKVLLILIERGGEIATRDEIKKKLWPNDTIVEFDHSINVAIGNLRRALGDSADEPKYIETLARRGYRLMVPVERVEAAADESSSGGISRSDGGARLGSALDSTGLIGKKVSHYRVLEVIGGGGMGLVYKAEDLKLGRRVALKFLPEDLDSDPVARQRFEREAQTASSLNHPNICTIYEIEEHESQPFIVMELLEGETLRDHLAASEAKAVPLDQLLDIAIQICDGLQAAHQKGIIHRDIKPANVFLTTSGQVKILDFGVAKLVAAGEKEQAAVQAGPDGSVSGHDFSRAVAAPSPELSGLQPAADSHLTRTGSAMGTTGYMSPEQVRGEKLDARTDLFSFGLVLYEMATGQRAFSGETAAVVQNAILNNSPVPVRELNSTLPPKLVATIEKALEKDRERRYEAAAEMRVGLQQLNAKRWLYVPATWKWYATAALVIAVVLGGSFYWHSRDEIKLTDKDTVVVAHFQNATGDPVIDDALDWPLTQKLQESPYLTLLYPSKVHEALRLLKASENAKLTPELAREVCLTTNSRAFVTASIADAGNHYQIKLKAVGCHSGKILAKVEMEANTRNEIVKALGVAGHQLRRELGEPETFLRTFDSSLENDMSWSLEALQAFSQGLSLRGEQGDSAAIPQFKRAVEIDPNFALAHINLAATYQSSGETPLVMRYASKAYDVRERMSQRSRWFVEALYYDMGTGELEKANAIYLKWMQTFPMDVYPHQDLSVSLRTLGQHERAAVEAREAVRLTPNIQTYFVLMMPFIYMNRLEEAKAVFEEARARRIDDLSLRSNRYVVASLQHDGAGMQEQLSWALAQPEARQWALQQQGDSASYHGRFRGALGFYSTMRSYSPGSAATLAYAALRDVETGNALRARQAAERALAAAPTSGIRRILALVFARVGAVDQAEKLVKSVDQESPLDTLVQKYELPTIRAAIELEKNGPARAIQVLQPALPVDLAVPDSFIGLYPAYVRGLAYLKLGKGREAAAEFQKVVDHPGILQDFITAPLSHLQLARAQAMMGDKAAARKSYQDFLTLWKDADPDIPIYQQAKAESARLR